MRPSRSPRCNTGERIGKAPCRRGVEPHHRPRVPRSLSSHAIKACRLVSAIRVSDRRTQELVPTGAAVTVAAGTLRGPGINLAPRGSGAHWAGRSGPTEPRTGARTDILRDPASPRGPDGSGPRRFPQDACDGLAQAMKQVNEKAQGCAVPTASNGGVVRRLRTRLGAGSALPVSPLPEWLRPPTFGGIVAAAGGEVGGECPFEQARVLRQGARPPG